MNLPSYITKPEDLMDLIFVALNRQNISFSKSMAAKIVGGGHRLEKLVMKGDIRMDKPTCKQNGKWFCNAADVIRHIRL